MSKTATLADLEKLADELLEKSEKTQPVEEPKPEEIAEVPTETKEKPEEKEPEKATEKEEAKATSEPKGAEPEETEDEPKEDEETTEPDKDELEKSLTDDFSQQEDIAKGMDASEFLSSVVEILSKSLADVSYDLQISTNEQKQSTGILVKSLQASLALNKSLITEVTEIKSESAALKKSLETGLGELKGILQDVLSQPATVRKSVGNIQVMDKSFSHSIGNGAGDPLESMSKSQVMDVLSSELYKGNPSVSAQDIISYESGAPLRPELVSLISNRK